MFRRSDEMYFQRINATRTETLAQVIEPLRKYWPNMVSELSEAIQKSYGPSRVGEVMAQGFTQLIDSLERDNERTLNELSRKFYDQEKELKESVRELARDKERAIREINNLLSQNEDLSKQIHLQNTLIADLHRSIGNLTGAADQSSST